MKTQIIIGDFLFDGEEIIKDYGIKIDNGIISWIGKKDELNKDEMEKALNLNGKFVTPGIIDSHVHLMSSSGFNRLEDTRKNAYEIARGISNANALLETGVVYCRDLGSPHGYVLGIRDAIKEDEILATNILATGKAISVTGGHGYNISLECDGEDSIRQGVRQIIKDGADVVKIMISGGVNSPGPEPGPCELTRDEIRVGIETAHAWGRKVAVHSHGNTAIRYAVLENVDSIEHGVFMTEDIMDMMVEKGTYLVPTLSAPHYAVKEGLKQEPDNPDHKKSGEVIVGHKEVLRKCCEKGVPIAFGTDAGAPFVEYREVLNELTLMVEAGLSEIEAFKAATKGGADLLGVNAGEIKIGKEAHFVAFHNNPFENIENVRNKKDVYTLFKDKVVAVGGDNNEI